ncbi:MAG: acyltransferase [bacterium]|nr:MAG: acyltransferase [bacterium]
MIDYFYHLIFSYKIKRLKKRGLKIGRNTYLPPGVFVDPLYPFLIEIGSYCRFATEAVILAHDATAFRDLGVTRLGKVRILDGCFIGIRAIILPGCTIGPNAVIAAGSVVNRDIAAGMMAAGNPARPYGSVKDLINKYQETMDERTVIEKVQLKSGIVSGKEISSKLEVNKWVFLKGRKDAEDKRLHWYMRMLHK